MHPLHKSKVINLQQALVRIITLAINLPFIMLTKYCLNSTNHSDHRSSIPPIIEITDPPFHQSFRSQILHSTKIIQITDPLFHQSFRSQILHSTNHSDHRPSIPQIIQITDPPFHQSFRSQTLHSTNHSDHRSSIPPIIQITDPPFHQSFRS